MGMHGISKCLKQILYCANKLKKKYFGNPIPNEMDVPEPVFTRRPSVYHAVVIIFLEFFAWGLLTTPMMDVLRDTFQGQTFLFNGLIQGIKGFLSFISAPILGALSDVWGRKNFLLVTVFFTCAPIPLMIISPWSFFAMISLSGAFAVTFSIVFAYVADITDEINRSSAYGLISATFAASLVTSPAIGAYMSHTYSVSAVVTLATLIGLLDFFFIVLFVPESLPKSSTSNNVSPMKWSQNDFFTIFKGIGRDQTLLLFSITVFLSYLPEAGQYTCIFVYLRHVIGFSDDKVAMYIAVVGILSIVAQTAILTILFQVIGNRPTIILGLIFQIAQLLFYAFGKLEWTMWVAGVFASLSSLNYPALSSLVSSIVGENKQGVAQGMITGVRGLCTGLGPAMFGVAFHVFNVELDPTVGQYPALPSAGLSGEVVANSSEFHRDETILPGPPFLFGSFSAILALITAFFLPHHRLKSATYRALPVQDSSLVVMTTTGSAPKTSNGPNTVLFPVISAESDSCDEMTASLAIECAIDRVRDTKSQRLHGLDDKYL